MSRPVSRFCCPVGQEKRPRVLNVLALSLAGAGFASGKEYLDYLRVNVARKENVAQKGKIDLLVLPAYTALLLAWRSGWLRGEGFMEVLQDFFSKEKELNQRFLDLNCSLARSCQVYLVPGTSFTAAPAGFLHQSYLISPEGIVLGIQAQTHLSREERRLGLARSCRVTLFTTAFGTVGLLVGTDAWYPEVSRILALQGAEIVCCSGALPGGTSRWLPVAGVWQEVQQNQFFAVESRLTAKIADREFRGESLIHAPCELTAGMSGYLAQAGPAEPGAQAVLDRQARQQFLKKYAVLAYLNPEAYRRYFPAIYEKERDGGNDPGKQA